MSAHLSVDQIGIVALHFGHLRWWEQLLVYLLGVGPFILLGLVVRVVRKRDAEAEEAERREAERAAADLPHDQPLSGP